MSRKRGLASYLGMQQDESYAILQDIINNWKRLKGVSLIDFDRFTEISNGWSIYSPYFHYLLERPWEKTPDQEIETIPIEGLAPGETRYITRTVDKIRQYGVAVYFTNTVDSDLIDVKFWGKKTSNTDNPYTVLMYHGLASVDNQWKDMSQQWRYRNVDGKPEIYIAVKNMGKATTNCTLNIVLEPF